MTAHLEGKPMEPEIYDRMKNHFLNLAVGLNFGFTISYFIVVINGW